MYFTPVKGKKVFFVCVCVCMCVIIIEAQQKITFKIIFCILRYPFKHLKKKPASTVRSSVTTDRRANQNTSKQLCMLKQKKIEDDIRYKTRSPEAAKYIKG